MPYPIEGEITDVIICRQLSVSKGHRARFKAVSGVSRKGKRAVGIRTRRQAQLEEEGDVVSGSRGRMTRR